MQQHFRAELVRPSEPGTWTYFKVPFNVETLYSSKARVPVKGTINGYSFSSSLLPRGNGSFIMVVNQNLRNNIGLSVGDVVDVTMELDTVEREVEVPDDLAEALSRHQSATDIFSNFSYSRQKEYVDWINDARKLETRKSRVQKAVLRIGAGKRLI